MKRKALVGISVCLAALVLLAACSNRDDYTKYIDSEKRIAVEAGDVYGDLSRNLFKARTQEHNNVDSLLEALDKGYVDAILIGDGFVRNLQDNSLYDHFDYIYVPEEEFINKAGHIFHTEELKNKYNEWLEQIKNDGTLDEILQRWLGEGIPAFEDIPVIELTGENGTLRVCDTGNYPPLSYYENNVLVGFDMEMAHRFAAYLGMDLDVVIVDYDEIEEFVLSGQIDMSAATKAVTEQRSDELLFGEPCLITQAVLIVKKN